MAEQYAFGSGSIYGLRTDISNPTPVLFGTCQDASVDFTYTEKELRGQYQAAVAIGRGGLKITGKIKAAKIAAKAFNDLFFGQTVATGRLVTVVNEGGPVGTAIPTTPYQLTAVNGATGVDDLGVINAATGVQLQRVASAPIAGQYSVVPATGVYTFSSADNVSGVKVMLSYTYTQTTSGGRIAGANQLMGAAPQFKLVLGESFNANGLSLVLYRCQTSKLVMGFKNEDFMIPEFDFSAMQNDSAQVYDWSSDQ
jgi:hypothetical protein